MEMLTATSLAIATVVTHDHLMPKSGAREREDEALSLVCAALSSAGRTVVVETWPDRDSTVEL